MAAELNLLKTRRNTIKTRLTKFVTFITTEENHGRIIEIQSRLNSIKTCLQEFEEIYNQISSIETTETDEDEFLAFEDEYFKAVSDAEELLINSINVVDQQIPASSNSNISNQHVKLPDIKLPNFSGSFTEWITFRDTFTSLIHDNPTLNPVQKLHYLRGTLKGEAHQTVEHLTPSNDNYEAAWKLLCDRFENKRLIIQHHVRSLFQLPTAYHKDPKTLRQILLTVNSNLSALASMQRPTEFWDDLLIYLIASKFDHNTTGAWESTLSDKVPTLKNMIDFITQRCQMLEAIESTNTFSKNANKFYKQRDSAQFVNRTSHVSHNQNQIKCNLCKQQHFIYNCSKFLSLTSDQRVKEIKGLNLCGNCLRNHTTERCTSLSKCKTCGEKHNSLLHVERASNINEPSSSTASSTALVASNHVLHIYQRNVLLSTAIIKVSDQNGKIHKLRALLDTGSQNHFITHSACQKLGLKTDKIYLPVIGIGKSQSEITRATAVQIQSSYNSYKAILSCLVLPEISLNQPIVTFDSKPLNIPTNIKLADPHFNVSSPVDLLIGNEIFWSLIKTKQIRPNGSDGPILQDTLLGYIVAAVLQMHHSSPTICNVSLSELEKQVNRFWEIDNSEHPPGRSLVSKETEFCENHFKTNYERNEKGQFIVKYPFKCDPPQLGPSKKIALQRFKSLERKLQRDKRLQMAYKQFMTEYLLLGHMDLVPPTEAATLDFSSSFYLPHHGVIKNSSSTTKLRVVFDGSVKSENNKSLNNNLFTGPALQQNLFSLLIRFRKYRFVIIGDLTKMYRQILIHPDHRNYQLILWRDDPNKPIDTYRLNTVTYGLASSPYLAIRCLQELAEIEAKNDPEIYNIIMHDFYVDDLVTGAESIERAADIREKLCSVLLKGGFELRKFASNCPTLIPEDQTSNNHNVSLDMQETTKTLGVVWDCQADTIKYCATLASDNASKHVSKRQILSLISKLFDPLGLVTPVTILAKIILQKTWMLNLQWDEAVPQHIHTMWSEFIINFVNLNLISIPRNVMFNERSIKTEIHGFCDASQLSYGACIYVRTIFSGGECKSHLLCSKNRVAPLKTTTVPRLELCGALLLAQLMNKVIQDLEIPKTQCFYWSDSTIVLSWLKMEPSNLKIFVAHRIAEIQSVTSSEQWHYVQTSENPADILSRGSSAVDLINSKLWWQGPDFLSDETVNFRSMKHKEVSDNSVEQLPEMKSTCCLMVQQVEKDSEFDLLSKFSSYHKLKRVTAYCLRFINNIKTKSEKQTGQLTVNELKNSETVIIRLIQKQAFPEDIHVLTEHERLSKNSKLKSLYPFLDENGLLRVGGRLNHANISFDRKHQIILPKNHPVTKLIVIGEHTANLHAGCQATLTAIRRKFWPISGGSLVRKIIKSCSICYKTKPISYQQLMANLPENRVRPSRPFTHTGLDYAGPYMLKNGFGRTNKTIKAFIVIFICFSTRAIHIELVCDYTTSTFLKALNRFMARRGKIVSLHSDNAANFVGARNELSKLYKLFKSQEFKDNVINSLANDDISWHFIPPRAPHMGGLWESAVKAMKRHLKRVIGISILNYEELYTVLTMIEACLNSRPLLPLSNDPTDLEPLTPGHFLIGEALRSTPEPDITEITQNRLSRYQMVEQMRQRFWKRWSQEILHHLQQRNKWTNPETTQPQIGALVVLKEDHLPPLHWSMGRIVEVHPGSDKRIRVVSVKTARGVIKRAVSKVCPLPPNDV